MAKEHSIIIQELVDLLLSGKTVDDLFEYVKRKLEIDGVVLNSKSAMQRLKLFQAKFRTRIVQCHRKKSMLSQKFSTWLKSEISFKISPSQLSCSVGRPIKAFVDCSKKSKLRKVKALREAVPLQELTLAVASSARVSGNRDVAWVIEFLSSNPEKATYIRRLLEFDNSSSELVRLSVEESLSFLCENDFTKQQYQSIRTMSLQRGSDIYPTYNELRVGKEMCYPDGIIIQPSFAKVGLQELVDHTVQRLFISQHNKISPFLYQPGYFSVKIKWGCDGTSHHSRYKMPFIEEVDGELETYNDSHIFLICLVPLRIDFHPNSTTSHIVWNNDLPSSINLCRPIKMVFKKETAELTKTEVGEIQKQLDTLNPTTVKINQREIFVQSEVIFSMVDGKVVNDLTNTSSQACHLCGATGKALSLPSTIPISDDPVDYEILPVLHAYIRSMEFLLNIAYRIPLKKWRINKGNAILKERQQTIRGKFKEIGLRISEPLPSGGNSNDGNTARKFFADPMLTAKITELDQELIYRFNTILRALSSKLAINVDAYMAYAEETRLRITELYPYYPLSPSVHRVLIHGAAIIKHCVLPIGMMTEEVQERRNKSVRKFREHHARQFSRQANIEDVFKRLLLTSDPVIALRKIECCAKYEDFPEHIQKLLLKQ